VVVVEGGGKAFIQRRHTSQEQVPVSLAAIRYIDERALYRLLRYRRRPVAAAAASAAAVTITTQLRHDCSATRRVFTVCVPLCVHTANLTDDYSHYFLPRIYALRH